MQCWYCYEGLITNKGVIQAITGSLVRLGHGSCDMQAGCPPPLGVGAARTLDPDFLTSGPPPVITVDQTAKQTTKQKLAAIFRRTPVTKLVFATVYLPWGHTAP